MPSGRKGHGLELGLVLLLNELLQFGINNIPPVTLSLILIQSFIYMGVFNVPWIKEEVCISGDSIIFERDWKRLLLAAIEHGDDMHLYYNMASFLLKGRTLEKRYNSKNFGLIILLLTVVTNVVYVFLAALFWGLTNCEEYMKSCAIGFSGVIFALKVLTTFEEPELRPMLVGVQMPAAYAAWIELILIHLLVPNSSFTGHLAGILAGVTYCYTKVGKYVDQLLLCITGQPIFHRGKNRPKVQRRRLSKEQNSA